MGAHIYESHGEQVCFKDLQFSRDPIKDIEAFLNRVADKGGDVDEEAEKLKEAFLDYLLPIDRAK